MLADISRINFKQALKSPHTQNNHSENLTQNLLFEMVPVKNIDNAYIN